MPSAVRRLLTNDAPLQITLANMLALALSFLTVPMISRAIGPGGRGETAAATAALAIIPVLLALGLPLEIRRRSAAGIDAGAVRAGRDLVLLSTLPALALAGIFVSTIYASTTPTMRILAFIGITLTPLGISWALDTGALVGAGRYRAVAVIRLTQPTIVILGVFLLWVQDRLRPEGVLVVTLLGTGMTALAGVLLVRVSPLGPRSSRLDLLRNGARYAGSAISETANARLDQVLVLPLIGAVDSGIYSIAASVGILPLALGQALAADNFRDMALADRQDRSELAARNLKIALSCILPASLMLGVGSIWLLPLVFGSAFSASVGPLWLYLPGSVCLSAGYVASMLLAAQARGRAMTVSQVVALLIGIILLYGLAPRWSALGAAAASTASYLVLFGVQIRLLGVSPKGLIPTPRALRDGVTTLQGREHASRTSARGVATIDKG